ncbi:hypothetical protein SNOG_03010 [Parastagonospora nodorum SN15]|uniref:Uncharacterized protein n=1 Tax=Phaeosphaeria nodorum (strain SN15 / ATCC MYA-4574 / FGSC 10173) TaxID=321614 RepID=Q0UZ04_PHANO|nr:hypothetical protein SNOG_03010 [Parastagonospora nodorum SN15]EAT89741.2 hypothetical protein SNOG_03010 [Parastagonospora nodorum SN15]
MRADENKAPAVIDDNKCSPQISIPNPEPEPEFHNFMQLARELRLVIWDLAMRDEPYHQPNGIGMRYFIDPIALREYVKVGDDPISPNFLPAICSVSEATKEEIIAVVIEGSKFMVASIKDNAFLQTFLKAAPGRLELCRDLSFDFFSRFPYGYEKNSDLELAVLCNGLRTIKLTFHFEPLTYLVMESEDNMTLSRRARSPNELLENFKLQRLLDCRSLKNITIEQTSQHVMEASRAANDLGELIKTKFSQLSPPQHKASTTCLTPIPNVQVPVRIGAGNPAAVAVFGSICNGFKSPDAARYNAACSGDVLCDSTLSGFLDGVG